MNADFLQKITLGDCRPYLPKLDDVSIDLFLSDIPYGINLDSWDVLHSNSNTALLGNSPSQLGKDGFKRRGKPINGWSQADRNNGLEYQQWCQQWATSLFPKMKDGAFLFVFGARRTIHRVINAFENSGFLLKDILAWKKLLAHQRAQRLSTVLKRRGLEQQSQHWQGWRIGNLAPIWEPIAWLTKPYRIGGTITDNILTNQVGAMNLAACKRHQIRATNLLEFAFKKDEQRLHEAQKPLALMQYLIELSTCKQQTVLDPFMGSGTSAVAATILERNFIGFELVPEFHAQALQRLEKIFLANSY